MKYAIHFCQSYLRVDGFLVDVKSTAGSKLSVQRLAIYGLVVITGRQGSICHVIQKGFLSPVVLNFKLNWQAKLFD